jgi:AcrR family transcriptional regulator
MPSEARLPGLAPMRISELSEHSGVTKSAIHHYVAIGLLTAPTRVRTNLYLYDETHLRRLESIRRLKQEENLSLEQVKEALDRTSLPPDAEELLAERGRGNEEEQAGARVALEMHHAKKTSILDKAISLFSRHGYDAVKISDITEALQMGKGTFYLYFKNKKELLLACFGRLDLLIAFLEAQDEIQNERDFLARMRRRWESFNQHFDAFWGVLRLLRGACRSDEEDVRESANTAYAGLVAPLVKDIEEAMRGGSVRPINEELASYCMVGMAEGLGFRLSLDSEFSNEDAADVLFSILGSGLAANAADAHIGAIDRGFSLTLTDCAGMVIEMTNARFNGGPSLSGSLGESRMQADPSKLSKISVFSSDSTCTCLLTGRSGAEMSLEVDGDMLITGDTLFGSLEIPIRRVSLMTVQARQN